MVHHGEDQVMLDFLKKYWYLLLMSVLMLDAVWHRDMFNVALLLFLVCISYRNTIKDWYRRYVKS